MTFQVLFVQVNAGRDAGVSLQVSTFQSHVTTVWHVRTAVPRLQAHTHVLLHACNGCLTHRTLPAAAQPRGNVLKVKAGMLVHT